MKITSLANGAVEWIEEWPDMAAVNTGWHPITSPIPSIPEPGTLRQGPQVAGALVSNQKFRRDKQLLVRGRVRSMSHLGGPYYGALGLFYDVPPGDPNYDKNYYTIAEQAWVPPTAWAGPSIVVLNNEVGTVMVGNEQIWTWHEFQVVWTPPGPSNSGNVQYWMDGKHLRTWYQQYFLGDVSIWLGAVTVGEGQNSTNEAIVEFGPITVIGTLV